MGDADAPPAEKQTLFPVPPPTVALRKPGSSQSALAINPDFAPTFMDIAGLPVPADMQGRSFVPLLKGQVPADWRTSFYYRYYHDPGDHNTRAHYGVRTTTHKLIYFWKKDQWEMYDLQSDPLERTNLAYKHYQRTPAQEREYKRLRTKLAKVQRTRLQPVSMTPTQPSGRTPPTSTNA